MIDRFNKFSSLIFEVSRHWHKITADEMEKYDLKGAYAVYLSALYRSPGGITSAKLAEMCCRDKADVSRAITIMEQKGMIVKISPNNNSYRAAIKLTDKGMEAAKHVFERSALAVEFAGMGTTDSERAVFYRVLENIALNLQCISQSGLSKESMNIKAVLFDLDGTLLPMDQDEFMKVYFGGLCKKLAVRGYEPDTLVKAIWSGTKAMYKNDGSDTNENVFWSAFKKIYLEITDADLQLFERYYEEDFDKVSEVAVPDPRAKKAVEFARANGLRISLATNPLFPSVATKKRIAWAGFEEKDFEFFTSFEDSNFTKPNPEYYRDIVSRMGLKPCECLMVGNDVKEDMAARDIGMKVFLITDHMINKDNKDISEYPHGNFDDLIEYINDIK